MATLRKYRKLDHGYRRRNQVKVQQILTFEFYFIEKILNSEISKFESQKLNICYTGVWEDADGQKLDFIYFLDDPRPEPTSSLERNAREWVQVKIKIPTPPKT